MAKVGQRLLILLPEQNNSVQTSDGTQANTENKSLTATNM
jgi:hypothetical protein